MKRNVVWFMSFCLNPFLARLAWTSPHFSSQNGEPVGSIYIGEFLRAGVLIGPVVAKFYPALASSIHPASYVRLLECISDNQWSPSPLEFIVRFFYMPFAGWSWCVLPHSSHRAQQKMGWKHQEVTGTPLSKAAFSFQGLSEPCQMKVLRVQWSIFHREGEPRGWWSFFGVCSYSFSIVFL